MSAKGPDRGIDGLEAQTLCAPLTLACSPRKYGNCDSAAALFAWAAFSDTASVTHLRSHPVSPCIACDACAGQDRISLHQQAVQGHTPLWKCPLGAKDDSAFLLQRLALASRLCIVAPIFFYHLPAQLKALLDRLQPVWLSTTDQGEGGGPFAPHLCHVILIAGRPRGDQLFTGSLLTLRHALAGLNIRLAEPLLLRGFDAPGSLAADSRAVCAIEEYAAEAGRAL